MTPLVAVGEFHLTREEWEEIYYALDSKVSLIENGEVGPCDHADDCETCDQQWLTQLRGIMAKIEPLTQSTPTPTEDTHNA